MGLFSNPKRELEKYFKRHPEVKTIVVTGAFGRTSAIRALGQILGQEYVVSFGVNKNLEEVPDVVILDARSSANFPDITPDFTIILSAGQTAEAKTYFDLANKSRHVLINREDVDPELSKLLTNPNIITYGDELPANYYFENHNADVFGQSGSFMFPDGQAVPVDIKLLGEHNLRPITMAAAMAHLFEIPHDKIKAGAESLRALPGHLSVGRGNNNSIIIDDSADTSLLSVQLALRTIYSLDTPSRILVTGKFDPAISIDRNLISEVLILDPKAQPQPDSIFKVFSTELELLKHLATRLEPDGIVLLELHLPDIMVSEIS